MNLVLRVLGKPLTYDKYASQLPKHPRLKFPQFYDFFNSKFKIQDSKFDKKESNVELLSFFYGSDGKFENNENNENVAIKRGQRLLADFAEREQRKDCEAGLIMGAR